ncbi:MAG: hypothetical protein M3N08_04965 [Pseudomonadota bacterium]|nr:hypothetical protein [Pseudomonadota bacterium]
MTFKKRLKDSLVRGTDRLQEESSKLKPLLSDKEFLIAAAGIVWTGFQLYTNPRRRHQLIQVAITSVVPAALPYLMKRFEKKRSDAL